LTPTGSDAGAAPSGYQAARHRPPDARLFVDDTQANLPAARELGMGQRSSPASTARSRRPSG
jgi:hypothetical protein